MKLLALLAILSLSQAINGDKVINCYWGTWANYRPGDGKFDASNIDPTLCTHLSYTFFGITDDGSMITLDDWLDNGLGMIKQTIALKQRNPKLKVLAVVGGWNEGSTKYSAMAADPAKRSRFISSALNIIRQNGFDGLDVDWEYPAQRGGSPADKVNFVTLLREIKAAFNPHGLVLGIAVGASEATAKISYDIPAISQHLDYINIMTYDFHMASDGYLGFNAPLPEVEASIDYWLRAGAPSNKVILGLGFYGRSYNLANTGQTTPGSSSAGEGSPGHITQQPGYLGYNEICTNNWQTVFDEKHGVPYSFSGKNWIGYDNVESIKRKVNLVTSKNLGGAMVWSIETDDFRGRCGETFPLLKTINRSLGNTNIPSSPPSPPVSNPPASNPPASNPPASNPPAPSGDCSSDGTFLNRSDCSKYYSCIGGIKYDFSCPSGLNYDSTTKNCNWPNLVNCNP